MSKTVENFDKPSHWGDPLWEGRVFPNRGIRGRATQIANASAIENRWEDAGGIFPIESHLVRVTNGSGGDATLWAVGVAWMGQHDPPRAGPTGMRSIHWKTRGGDAPNAFQSRATRKTGS